VRGTIKGTATALHCFTLPVGARPDVHANVQPTIRIAGAVNGYLDVVGNTGICTIGADTSPLASSAVSMLFVFSVLE
jgi:hypothetical protein